MGYLYYGQKIYFVLFPLMSTTSAISTNVNGQKTYEKISSSLEIRDIESKTIKKCNFLSWNWQKFEVIQNVADVVGEMNTYSWVTVSAEQSGKFY